MTRRSDLIPEDLRRRAEGNGHVPKTFTAAELLGVNFPAPRFAVPGIVPEGVTLFAGRPKMGKGWLVLGAGIAIATGGVALGKVPVEQGDCLYLALEDYPRRLQKRLNKLLASNGAPERLHLATEWARLDQGGAEALEKWIEERDNPRAVFIDTLAKVRPHQRGQNVYAEDYHALEPLLPLAAEHRVAIVVVHHLRKMGAADPLDEISGSTGLSGSVDGVLILKRDRGRADAYLHVDGRDIEEPKELALRWDAETAGWVIVGDADEYRLSEERAGILRVLEETGEPMTPTEVADALGVSTNTVKVRMWRMARDGQLSNDGGRYTPVTGNPGNPVTDEGVAGYTVTPVTGYSGEPEEIL